MTKRQCEVCNEDQMEGTVLRKSTYSGKYRCPSCRKQRRDVEPSTANKPLTLSAPAYSVKPFHLSGRATQFDRLKLVKDFLRRVGGSQEGAEELLRRLGTKLPENKSQPKERFPAAFLDEVKRQYADSKERHNGKVRVLSIIAPWCTNGFLMRTFPGISSTTITKARQWAQDHGAGGIAPSRPPAKRKRWPQEVYRAADQFIESLEAHPGAASSLNDIYELYHRQNPNGMKRTAFLNRLPPTVKKNQMP